MKARRLAPFTDFSHYLSIPIVSSASRPQLRASFAHFERENAAILPKGSMFNPDVVNLDVGRLRLESKERIDACSKHLHGLDLHKILHVAAVNAMSGPPKFGELPYIGEITHAFGRAITLDLSPLKVDVSGIFSPYQNRSQTGLLKTPVINRTHRLQHFQHKLLDSLFKAGFLVKAFHSSMMVLKYCIAYQLGIQGLS